jgi:hypothetical protein
VPARGACAAADAGGWLSRCEFAGWLYVPTGNLFKREQVQPSQDDHCHVCLGRGREHPSICAFIVPNV